MPPTPPHLPARPARQHSHPGRCPLRLLGPVLLAPLPIKPVPPWPRLLRGGSSPCMRPLPPSEGLFRRREAARGAGREGASPSSFSERAQSWSQKSRRRDIQTEPRRVWQEEREGEREREEGDEREKRRGRRGVLSFQIHALGASPRRDSLRCGTQGRPDSGGW